MNHDALSSHLHRPDSPGSGADAGRLLAALVYELAWNTLKDYLEAQGETDIHGSRDTFRLAFRRGLIEDGETWMDMLKSRTLTAHTYNEEIAEQIVAAVTNRYFPEFVRLQANMESWKEKAICPPVLA